MEKSQCVAEMKNENVKIMCLGNNYLAPCTSPFNLKLQTYLRMNEIDHEVVSCVMSSSEGKTPFVEIEGQRIEDSTNIIKVLNSQFGKNLNEKLSAEEIEKSFEFQDIVEKKLFYSMEYQRWFLDDKIIEKFPLPNWFFRFIFKLMLKCKFRPELLQEMEIHNLAKCSPEELIELAETSLTAISQHIGDNPYFMGKSPSEIDATMFGFLAILLNGMETSSSGQFVVKKLPNLVSYVERMKEEYWPDWDALCSPRKNRENGLCKTEKSRNWSSQRVTRIDVA